MRLLIPTRRSQANVLLTTLLVVFIAAALIGSYLHLVLQETNQSARSQAWNQCIPASEAGIEEALTLLNCSGSLWGWTNALATNGWSALSNNITSLSRALDGSNSFSVSIDVSSGIPKIDSIGYVRFVSAAGLATNLARKTELVFQQGQSGPGGLIASNAILINGNAYVDSFDSSTNTGSTGGQYDASKARDQITVATASKAANAFEADGSSRVYGYVCTGGGGTLFSGTSRAGDRAYVGAYGAWPPGVESGHLSTNFTFYYPSATNSLGIPTGGQTAVLNGTSTTLPTVKYGSTSYTVADSKNLGSFPYYQFGGTLYDAGSGSNPYLALGTVTNVVNGDFHVGASGYMVVGTNTTYTLATQGNFTLDGGPPNNPIYGAQNSISICPGCHVYIYAASNFTITASGRLYIDPTSTLTVVAGGNVTLSGAGLINTANATNLTLIGLATCTNITITASANFIGTVYAPDAILSISGASPFTGSCVARGVSLQGSGVFHYDEALKKGASSTSFSIANWQEKPVH